MNSGVKRTTAYDVIVMIIMIVLAILFIFPVYWIVTGSFKDPAAINAAIPEWFPKNPTTDNYVRLFDKPAMQWLFNSIFIALMSMGLTWLVMRWRKKDLWEGECCLPFWYALWHCRNRSFLFLY